jgi:NRAMP (natural resistance-associated macrophage protein)-like metal ion transporter
VLFGVFKNKDPAHETFVSLFSFHCFLFIVLFSFVFICFHCFVFTNQTASTMTGTFAGQYVMEGFLNWKVSPVVRVTITRSIALGPAIAVGLYMSLPGNSAAGDILNEWYEGVFFLCVVGAHLITKLFFFNN